LPSWIFRVAITPIMLGLHFGCCPQAGPAPRLRLAGEKMDAAPAKD